MPRIPEFYPTKQGRPATPDTIDLETGQTSLYSYYIFIKEEYDKMEELLEEQIHKLEELIEEAKKATLTLALMLGQEIEKDNSD